MTLSLRPQKLILFLLALCSTGTSLLQAGGSNGTILVLAPTPGKSSDEVGALLQDLKTQGKEVKKANIDFKRVPFPYAIKTSTGYESEIENNLKRALTELTSPLPGIIFVAEIGRFSSVENGGGEAQLRVLSRFFKNLNEVKQAQNGLLFAVSYPEGIKENAKSSIWYHLDAIGTRMADNPRCKALVQTFMGDKDLQHQTLEARAIKERFLFFMSNKGLDTEDASKANLQKLITSNISLDDYMLKEPIAELPREIPTPVTRGLIQELKHYYGSLSREQRLYLIGSTAAVLLVLAGGAWYWRYGRLPYFSKQVTIRSHDV